MLDLKKYLKDVGMQCFVNYYEYFEKDRSSSDMVAIITDNWTEKSKKSRTTKARAIFKENLQDTALKIIVDSRRVDSETRNKAKSLLQKK